MTDTTSRKPLRLWPGVFAVVLQWLFWIVVPLGLPGNFVIGAIGAAGGTLLIILWWLFFSRAAWSERIGALVVMIAAVLATRTIVHPSIANAGMGGLMFIY